MTAPLVTVTDVVKTYQALRPLRMTALELHPGAIVSVMGLDAPAAEMFVGLLTGAVLPDSGDIQLFGRSTRDVTDTDAWLAMLDRVGIVTDRAVLIAQFTVEQNVAMPFTLQVDPVAPDIRPRVEALAAEVGLAREALGKAVAASEPDVVARVRLARALALEPHVLIAEHASAALPRHLVKPYAADLARVAKSRGLAVLSLTGDDAFADALGGQVLKHDAATGALAARSGWRRIFR